MGCFQSKEQQYKRANASRTVPHDPGNTRGAQDNGSGAHDNNSQSHAETEVMKRVNAYDALDAQARAAPELVAVSAVAVGSNNAKLLDHFEAKEAAARASPKLRKVDKTDVRNSRIFNMLQEYEANDARVAAEPRLSKTFSQRTTADVRAPTPIVRVAV